MNKNAQSLPGAAEPSLGVREAANFRQPLRILHVINYLGVGGTELGVLKVIDGLNEGFEHHICTTRGSNPQLVESAGLGERVSGVGGAAKGFQLLVPALVRVMRQYKPHVVHSRNWGAVEAVLAARLAGTPVTIHSEHGYELEMLNGLSLRKRLLRRVFYSAAHCLFTVSKELREYHARQALIAKERIEVIPNGVDAKRFAPNPERGSGLRRELGLPAESLVLGSAGRLVPIKGHNTLLDAMEVLIARGVDCHLLVAGDGPELPRLTERVRSSNSLSGRVVFLGSSDRVPTVLNAMDVFVLPSICEGMSNTLMEAMASGLAVVASRVGGNPELVEENRTGRLFHPGNVKSLADQLESLAGLPDLRRQLGYQARQRILEDFSLDTMLSRYRDLYLGLARKQHVWRGQEAEYPCVA